MSTSQYTTKTSQTKAWMVIVNPAAGAGAVKSQWPKIKQELRIQKIEFSYLLSKYPKHILKLVKKAMEEGYKHFIGVGGDGTMNEIVNAILLNSGRANVIDFKIASIPAGTGNDWIKTHQIKNDIKLSIDYIKKNLTRFHDVGVIDLGGSGPDNTVLKYFINIAGIGFNTLVIEQTNEITKKIVRSKHNYLLGLIISLFKFKPPKLLLTIDDKSAEKFYFAVNAGICNYNGGGMKIVPHAKFDDGLLAVTIIEKISKWKVISNFFNLFDGSFIKNPEVSTIHAERMVVSSDNFFGIEMDGELLGNTRFVTINTLSKAIQVISAHEA